MQYRLIRFETGPFAENCYVLWNKDTKKAIIIDAGDDAAKIMELIDKEELQMEAILLTHGHIDHAGALKKVHELTLGKIAYHELEVGMVTSLSIQGTMFGLKAENGLPPDITLKGGEKLTFIGLDFNVLFTPGHTPGGVCYYLPGLSWVFAGDILFNGSIGRTDLPGGNYETLIKSIRDQLLTLPGQTVVLPGHGPRTTIEHERRTNPFLVRL